ncbi:testis-specific gene 13 protein isoform X2 [Erinaceus europaeus]|nr:testis-specific gene 13 protein isoform X2 [Erinaceus europaeus]
MQPSKLKYSGTTNQATVGDNEEIFDMVGQSKFVLKELHRYSIHPNLSRYYEPLKPTALQKFLTEHGKIRSFMLKVTEYDQDKTLLILTNNPLPSPFQQHGNDITPITPFSEEFQFTGSDHHPRYTENLYLPGMTPSKTFRSERKPTFPVTLLEELSPRQEQWFRFSTDKDFMSEGRYSQLHSLRKQKTMYPQLTFAPARRNVSKKLQSETWTSKRFSEPLTLFSLQEEKPTRVAPGEKAFRYGSARQWVIKNATVLP